MWENVVLLLMVAWKVSLPRSPETNLWKSSGSFVVCRLHHFHSFLHESSFVSWVLTFREKSPVWETLCYALKWVLMQIKSTTRSRSVGWYKNVLHECCLNSSVCWYEICFVLKWLLSSAEFRVQLNPDTHGCQEEEVSWWCPLQSTRLQHQIGERDDKSCETSSWPIFFFI